MRALCHVGLALAQFCSGDELQPCTKEIVSIGLRLGVIGVMCQVDEFLRLGLYTVKGQLLL